MKEPLPRFAGDIMTRDVVTLDRDESIDHLEESMRMLHCKHLPVVESGRVVGMVSQRDLLRATPSGPTVASAVMSRHVLTVSEATPLAEVGRLLIEHKIGALPVVDAQSKLSGIVTEMDFVSLAVKLLERASSA
jgi:acetoin utilization protein AcuB